VRVGLALPHYDYSFPSGETFGWDAVADAAARAEALGFASVWISDHFFLDIGRYGAAPGPRATLEPFTALAALATRTASVRLGTLVACNPFRHPALVAKMATTIDLLSGGRFDLGLGSGWFEPEFEAFGYPFGSVGERFGALEEAVEAIAALFADEGPVTFDGRSVHLQGAFNHPPPARPGGPPIWLGGKGGDRLLRLVARHATGWNLSWRTTPQAYGERSQALTRACEAAGRDPATARRSVGLYTLVGEDGRDLQARWQAMQEWAPDGSLDRVALEDFAEDTLTGMPAVVSSRLAAFAEQGVDEIIVNAAHLPFAVYDWSQVELIAATVIPAALELS
jgi:probable F420-dependent oxidoreductase